MGSTINDNCMFANHYCTNVFVCFKNSYWQSARFRIINLLVREIREDDKRCSNECRLCHRLIMLTFIIFYRISTTIVLQHFFFFPNSPFFLTCSQVSYKRPWRLSVLRADGEGRAPVVSISKDVPRQLRNMLLKNFYTRLSLIPSNITSGKYWVPRSNCARQ